MGLEPGSKQAIESSIELGKSAIGIISGNFESITQAHTAVKSGGIIDSISSAFDIAINKAYKSNMINNSIEKKLKSGKDIILNTIKANIENSFYKQISSLDKLSEHIEEWNKYYGEKNFEKMNYEYKQIQKLEKEILPIEETIRKIRKIENLNELIKNKGKDFNITDEEMRLAEKLVI